MNRRTFITGSAAAFTLAPMLGRVCAEDAVPEARWDEVSQLYGNAWDILPKAKEGEIETLSLISLGKNDWGNSRILGLIHNNSSEEKGLIDVNSRNITVPETFQLMIKPQGYAIVMFSDFDAADAGDVSSKFTLTFGSDNDVKDSEIYVMNAELYDNSFPMKIDGVVFDSKYKLTTTLSTTGEESAEGAKVDGLIIVFDEHGVPKDAAVMGSVFPLEGGSPWEQETSIFVDDINETAMYLAGYRASKS